MIDALACSMPSTAVYPTRPYVAPQARRVDDEVAPVAEPKTSPNGQVRRPRRSKADLAPVSAANLDGIHATLCAIGPATAASLSLTFRTPHSKFLATSTILQAMHFLEDAKRVVRVGQIHDERGGPILWCAA